MVVNTCVVQQQKEKEQAHSRRQRAAGAQRGWVPRSDFHFYVGSVEQCDSTRLLPGLRASCLHLRASFQTV